MTTKFTDKAGRVWDLELTVGTVERIHKETGVDLNEVLTTPEKIGGMFAIQPKKFAQVLWVIVEDQAQSIGTTPEIFGASLNRTAIDSATDALLAAIVLFFPRASAGNALAERLPAMIQAMDAEIAQRARNAANSV